MRYLSIVCISAAILMAAGAAAAPDNREDRQGGVPLIATVSPSTAKTGDVVTITGQYLDKSRLLDLYLTDGKNDLKTQIIEQGEQIAKFRIPVNVAPGRYRLMVLMAGPEPKLLEQPVTIKVE